MDQIKQLKQLRHLAGVKRDVDVAQLERLKVQLRAVEMQIDRLEQAAVESDPDPEQPSPFKYSGRDALWDAWRLSRIRELAQKSARIRADIEQQTVKARRSVGKHQVLGKLVERKAPVAPQAW